MAITTWGISDLNPELITGAPGAQFKPAVADNGGTEFGVAWTDGSSVTVAFFDEQGLPNVALPGGVMSDGVYGATGLASVIQDVQIVAGGTGLGYGVAFQETAPGAGHPSLLRLRYYDTVTTSVLGGEVAISSTNPALGLNQHSLSISNYTQDGLPFGVVPPGATATHPNVDGFDAAWVESATSGAHDFGTVYVQRFAVQLDSRKDPIGAPLAAGLDGQVGVGLNDDQVKVADFGRDPSVAGLLGGANETVVSYVDSANRVNVQVYSDTGALILTPPASGTTVASGEQHVLALAGGGFVVAWVGDGDAGAGVNKVVLAKVFAPGAAAGAFTPGPTFLVHDVSEDVSDFTLAALPDTGGFTVSWSGLDGATNAIFTKTFNAGGVAGEFAPTILHVGGDADGAAATGLVGDRVVVVYQDNTNPADPNIGAQIYDTRTLDGDTPIESNALGIVLIGDAGKVLPDVLVGTDGNDVIIGLADNDILDGGLGNDRIFAGAGNDTIDGGGNSDVNAAGGDQANAANPGAPVALANGGDVVVFTGARADYSITYTGPTDGSGSFVVIDLRAGSPDGTDIIRRVESFEFTDGAVAASDLAAVGNGRTMTLAGWGNENTFDYLVEHGTRGLQAAPAATGSAEGGPTLAFITERGVEVQFYDNLGESTVAAAEVASRVLINPVADGKTNLQITDAIAGIVVAWQQHDASGNGNIGVRGLGAEGGVPFGTELAVGSAGMNNHDFFMGGYTFPLGLQVPHPHNGNLIDAVADGVDIVWVASNPGDTSGLGQIVLQRYEVITDSTGTAIDLRVAGADGQHEADALRTPEDAAALQAAGLLNDDPVIIAALGKQPTVTGLHTGETVVTWLDAANGIHAKLFPPQGTIVPSDPQVAGAYDNVNALLAQISGHVVAAPNGGPAVQVVQSGAGNFAVMWLEAAAGGGFDLHGTYFSLPPDVGFVPVEITGWTAIQIQPIHLHDGFTGEFHLAGFGEDNPDVILTYTASDGDGTGIYARHIDGLMSGLPEQVLGASADFLVNTTTAGDQSGGAVAGMVADRAIITYYDAATGDTIARVVDTREADQFLQGDKIRDRDFDGLTPGDVIQARADQIVGTVGNDTIIGDLVDPALGGIAGIGFTPGGKDDFLAGGLGNDVIFGGGGNDTIDGGLNLRTPGNVPDPTVHDAAPHDYTDIAVFQGDARDYAIWINGDGSYSVVDARFDDGRNIVDTLANGAQNVDGLDFVSNVEKYLFLGGVNTGQALFDLSYNGVTPSLDTDGHVTLDSSFFYTLPDEDHRVTGNVESDGIIGPSGLETVETPVGWGLTQDFADNGFDIAGTAGVADGVQTHPMLATTEGGFVAGWLIAGAAPGLVGIQIEAIDPLARAVPTAAGPDEITVTLNARADIPPVVSGIGAGPTVAWVDDTNHLHLQVYDANGVAVAGPDGVGLDLGAGNYSQLALGNPQLRDVIDPSTANDADPVELDDQVALAWVQDADAGGNGAIMFQRWAVPTNNDRSTGTPVAIGRDGQIGGDSDLPQQLTITDAGGTHAVVGRNPIITGVESGWTIATWTEGAGASQVVHGMILDTLTGQQLMEIAPTTMAVGSHAWVLGPGDPSNIVVGHIEANASGGFDVIATVYKQAATSFVAESFTLKHFDTATIPNNVNLIGAGTDKISLLVTWDGDDGTGQPTNASYGQRYDFETGAAVGHTFTTVTGTTAADTSSAVGLLDGHIAIAYTQQDVGGDVDVHARIFDTNDAITPIIERDAGGPAGLEGGTIFDDIIDGRDRSDELHGGLGNDVVIGGWNDDTLFGEDGKDALIGGSGTDTLDGGAGDDLLMGGQGRDYITGGDGVDTISFQGEFRDVTIDLSQGIVTSDAAHNAVDLAPAAAIVGLPANAATDANIEDVIGIVTTDPVSEVTTFVATHDVENAYGGLGNDTLIGDEGDNVFWGGGGSNSFTGNGGTDTVIINGIFSTYSFSRSADGTVLTISDGDDTQTIRSVEILQFDDRKISVADLFAHLPVNSHDVSGASIVGVTNINASPVANGDTAIIQHDTSVTIDVLANDSDPDVAQSLSVLQVNGQTLGATAVPVAHGTVLLTEEGKLYFTPTAGFAGDTSFQYTASDGNGGLATATVTLHVIGPPPPTAAAHADTYAGTEDTTLTVTAPGVLTNDTNFDNTTLVAVLGAGTAHGTLVFNANGSFTYTPNANFNGVDSFTYRATDGHLTSDLTTVTINVAAVNDAPVAATAPETRTLAEDTVASGQLLAGFDVDGDALTYALVAGSAVGGSVTISSTGAYVFTPANNFAGQASFSYRLNDGTLNSAAKQVVLTYTPVNDGDAAASVTGNGFVGSVVTAALGADPDGAVIGTPTRQWLRDGVNITGATGATYTLAAADAGHVISVAITYKDGQNFTTTVNGALAGLVGISQTGTAVVNNFTGTAGNDLLDGAGGNDTLNGLAGDDRLLGGAGNDVISGGDGNDSVDAGAGNDTISGDAGDDVIDAGAGTDIIQATIGDGNDNYDGNAGTDTLDMSAITVAITANFAAGTVSSTQTGSDTIVNLENLIGGSGDDTLTGDAGNNQFDGGAGNDVLDGGTAGTDRLTGGLGDDTYIINHTGETIVENAGEGVDTVFSSVTITLAANVENLVLTGTASANGTGNADNNVITGNSTSNVINGAGGDDRLVATINDGNDSWTGAAGIDTYDLSGTTAGAIVDLTAGSSTSAQTGNDTLATIENVIGSSGNDVIAGSTQVNTFTGGAGADTFVFATRQIAGNGAGARDIITDFTHLTDKIDFSQIDSDTRAASAGVQHWVFDGQVAAGSEAQGHVGYHYEIVNGVEVTVIEGNIRTAAAVETTQDFQVELQGHVVLTSADFIFGGP